MPLRDHFRPPLSVSHPWRGFHSAWATTIAQQLNDGILPARYYAIPNVQLGGPVEIDVATLEDASGAPTPGGPQQLWTPPAPAATIPVDFSQLDVIEVQVFYDEGGPQLMAAVELISPANKDRPGHRRAFTVKCGNYIQQGTAVVLVDVVTERRANLHAELLRLLGYDNGAAWESPTQLYAVAYRPVPAETGWHVALWPETLTLGGPLPRLPLWIGADFSVPLDLEKSYLATCSSLRLRT